MMIITGILPSNIANDLNVELNKVMIKGSDIDINITLNDRLTSFNAIGIGNDKFEITELDDGANLFPTFEEGDVINKDEVSDALFDGSINSSAIMSFNLKGKIKKGLKNIGKKFTDKIDKNVKKVTDKVNAVKDWATDSMDKQQAQDFLRKQGLPVKVGDIRKVNSEDGATYKVLAGNYKDKNYYGYYIHRNGNDIEILYQHAFSGDDLQAKQQLVVEWYNEIDPEWEDTSTTDDNVIQDAEDDNVIQDAEIEEVDPSEAEKFEHSDETQAGNSNVIDDVEYEIVDASLKKKKKSKYNGCNVTGCEDGNLTGASL